jgi:DUF4097 and DUF4098 domain-containing protein YvlB
MRIRERMLRRMIMKRTGMLGRGIAVLAVVVLAAGHGFGRPLFGEKYEEKFQKTEALAADGRVSISNVSGAITIKSWAKNEVLIDAVKVCNVSSAARAKENMAQVTIEIKKDGSLLQIDTKYPEKSRNLNVSVTYALTIPSKASVKVRNVSGSVDATGIGGAFDGNVTSGGVTLTQIADGVDCTVISGQLKVSDVQGDVNAKTVSGNVDVSGVKGSVDAESTSGRIILTGISEPKSVRAKVLSGRISYDGQIVSGGKYSFESLSGGIGLTLPASAGFDLEAETFSGSISSEFAVTMQGKIDKKELRGVVNNGGAALRIKAFSGSIDIKKK